MLQAAGHSGALKQDSSQQGFILKPFDATEAKNYEALWNLDDDPLQQYVARWGGSTEVKVGSAEAGESRSFMRLGNLLESFSKPCVMDCKMGLRTFQEKEAANPKPRPDLYQRLMQISPELLDEEDRKAEAITKFKWMTSRDKVSTSGPLKFRIDGIVSEQGARVRKEILESIKTKDEVLQVLPRILPLHFAADHGSKEAISQLRVTLVQQIVAQLESLLEAMEKSTFFKANEFVGSSLLFVVDAHQARVHLIDLAKTEPLPEGVMITHRSSWKMGNHEDGMLLGVENLIDCWKETLVWLEGKNRRKSLSDSRNRLGDLDMQELEGKLSKHGVNTSSWGSGGAKSIMELFLEINEERAVTFETAEDGRFFRVINVIKVWILLQPHDGETLVLCEPKKRQLGQDATWGNAVQGKPLQKKVSTDQTWQDTITVAIEERLGISPEVQLQLFEWQHNSYKMRIDIRQGTVSDGYDGLWSKYRIHEIDIGFKDPHDSRLSRLGLPDGVDFVTVQTAGLHSAFGHRQHAWKWIPAGQAGYSARDTAEASGDSANRQIASEESVSEKVCLESSAVQSFAGRVQSLWRDSGSSALSRINTLIRGSAAPVSSERQREDAVGRNSLRDGRRDGPAIEHYRAEAAGSSSCCCGAAKLLSSGSSRKT